jgi:peptidoglycan lytic transglycosylase
MPRAWAGWIVVVSGIAAACVAARHQRPGGPSDARATSSAWVARAERPSPLLALIRDRPVLDDLAQYVRARDAARTGDDAGALAQIGTLAERHPESIWLASARLLAGQLRRRAGDLDGARGWLEAARGGLEGERDRWIACTVTLGEVDHLRGDDAAALDLARAARAARPRGIAARRARRLTERIRRRRPELFVTTASHLAEAKLLLDEPDGARSAAVEAEDALAGAPSNDERATALWIRARAERALGEQANAESTCLEVARLSTILGPKALGTAARWRWNADDDAGALRLYRQVATRFPGSDAAIEARYAVGRIHQEAGRYDEAFEAYDALAREEPRAPLAAEARWRAGWVRYLGGDPRAAASYFATIATDGPPTVQPAAAYWDARMRGMLADPDADARLAAVIDEHPTSYYAALAAERLGRAVPDAGTVVAPPPLPFPDELSGVHAERARALAELGLPALARRELDAIGDDAPRLAVAQAYTAVGALNTAITTAQAVGTPADERARRFLYPLGFWPLVEDEARARGVDPLLVVSLIRQESLFVPDAVSPADAHGLMQLLPRTAREIAPAAGVTPADAKALDVPATNVRLGTMLLRRLLDRYAGSRAKALAAYNGGEEAVAKWERRYGPRPEDEFTELISFRETRDYVKLVLQNLHVYRQLYAASAAATSRGNPPNAPFDMIATTSPGALVATR